MVSLRSQGGKIIIKDGKVGTDQKCCCGTGSCCIDYGTQCSAWVVKVSIDGFSDHYTGSSAQCFCSVSGENWEIYDEWNSLDNTKKIVISGALYYSCIDGQCTFGGGGFSIRLIDIATNNDIGEILYEANEVDVAINNFPFNITFTKDNVFGQDFSSGISILLCAFFSEFINETGDPLLCPAGATPPAGNNNTFCLNNVPATVCSDLYGVYHPNQTCEENPCQLGACCYSVPTCVRSFCADTVMQNGYWIQVSPPGSPTNPSSDLFLCEYIPDPTAFPSDGCQVYYNTTVVKPDGYCGGAAVGFANEYSCVTNLVGGVRYCDDNVSQSYCDEKNGFFYLGQTCQDMEEVNGQPGCGIEGPYVDGF